MLHFVQSAIYLPGPCADLWTHPMEFFFPSSPSFLLHQGVVY